MRWIFGAALVSLGCGPVGPESHFEDGGQGDHEADDLAYLSCDPVESCTACTDDPEMSALLDEFVAAAEAAGYGEVLRIDRVIDQGIGYALERDGVTTRVTTLYSISSDNWARDIADELNLWSPAWKADTLQLVREDELDALLAECARRAGGDTPSSLPAYDGCASTSVNLQTSILVDGGACAAAFVDLVAGELLQCNPSEACY